MKYTIDDWLDKAKSVHGDRYDYSLIDLNKVYSIYDRIKVLCHQHETPLIFEPTLNNHVNIQSGCPTCGRNFTGKKKIHIKIFHRKSQR